ncbi:hypothetical protein NUH87_29130 [Pseudomonas batumici]|uniref:hypothetical protein n=1 Tax=Pseudomonas batumici TaxID=226910 RepID=UPI0030CBEDC3
MKTYCPTFWPNGPGVDHSAPTIHLDDLLPRIGSTTSAYFNRRDFLRVGETIRLIWCPPVSDLNSWGEQPSEIAFSHLLTATVVSPASVATPSTHDPHFIHRGMLRYDLEILSCERLLPALKAFEPDGIDWHLQMIGTPRGTILAWDEIHWCGRATVEGLIYLTANTRNEAYLELLLEPTDDSFIGLFSLHMNPGGVEYDLGRKRFTSNELRAIKRALALAHPLQDSQPTYLVTT